MIIKCKDSEVYTKVLQAIGCKEYNIDLDVTVDDFRIYDSELKKVANLIYDNYNVGIEVAVNVITDLLTASEVTIPMEHEEFALFCKHCPCYQCKPDPDLFESVTGDRYFPPKKFCEKSFVELDASRYLINKLELDLGVSDISFEEFRDVIHAYYGAVI